MKCLVLLVLVAVCQGAVLPDSSRSERIREQRIENPFSKLERSNEYPKLHVRLDQQKQRVPQGKTMQIIQEQREKRQRGKQYPVKKYFLSQKLEQSPFKTLIDVSKQWQKSPLEPTPQNTPFIQYTTPQTFLDHIKSTSNVETWKPMTSVYPDVLDFKTFMDLIQFPGGDFLQNEIDKCLWHMPEDARLPVFWSTKEFKSRFPFFTSTEIDLPKVQGVRDVLPYIVTKLEKMVPLYMQTTSDPSTMAMLVTRDLIKIVLQGRMKCPATIWDKTFIENIDDQLYKITNGEKYQLLENFRTLIPEVLPDVSDITDQVVYTIARDVQEQVNKDVMQYTHGVAFKDVAIVSHKLYHELELIFEESWHQDVSILMEGLVTTVADVIVNYGTCPRVENLYRKNQLACWEFNKLFLDREVANIHSRVMNIVHHFLYRTCTGEECMQYYPRMTEVFKTIIKRYISNIIERVPICHTPECLDPTECLINEHSFQGPNLVERTNWVPLWNTLISKTGQSRQL